MVAYFIGLAFFIGLFKWIQADEEIDADADLFVLSMGLLLWPLVAVVAGIGLFIFSIFGVIYTFGVLVTTPVDKWKTIPARLWQELKDL